MRPNFYSAQEYYPSTTDGDRKRCQTRPCWAAAVWTVPFTSGRTELLAECRTLGGCRTGEAKATRAYRLPCRYVIHTPGPIWRGGHAGEAVLLAGCYQNCLRIASELNCKTVAFPSISTGVYRFPLNRAAEIAIRTIEEYLSTHAEIEQVSMICFDGTTLSAYQNALSEWEANHV